jgi:hypothetical protein
VRASTAADGGQAATVGRKICGAFATEAAMPHRAMHFRHPILYTAKLSVLESEIGKQARSEDCNGAAEGAAAAEAAAEGVQ